MKFYISTEIELAVAPDVAFDFISDSRNLARFVRPLGPIPGVERCETLASDAGALEHRNVYMTDGTITEEQVVAFERPRLYRYRWLNPPQAPLHWLIRTAESNWVCEAAAFGTQLEWTYELTLTSALAYPATWLFARKYGKSFAKSSRPVPPDDALFLVAAGVGVLARAQVRAGKKAIDIEDVAVGSATRLVTKEETWT